VVPAKSGFCTHSDLQRHCILPLFTFLSSPMLEKNNLEKVAFFDPLDRFNQNEDGAEHISTEMLKEDERYVQFIDNDYPVGCALFSGTNYY
jgi:hypothetical protein